MKRRDGFGSDLLLLYRNLMNDLRKDASVPSKAEFLKKKFIAAIRKGRAMSLRTTSRMHHYGWTVTVFEKRLEDGYVSAAEAAGILGLSRQRISKLFIGGKLSGYRINRSVFILEKDLEHRKKAQT